MRYAAENTLKYDNDFPSDVTREEISNETPVKIYIVDGDCLEAAMVFKTADPRCHPVVLNMASSNHPGGGWRNGSTKNRFRFEIFIVLLLFFQVVELKKKIFIVERICFNVSKIRIAISKRLATGLIRFRKCVELFLFVVFSGKKSKIFSKFGGIYSPDVTVFRGAEIHGYPFFPSGPQYISFIACAAYSHPPTETNDRDEQRLSGNRFIQNTKRKIETIFQIAAANRHDVLILSAFGW